MSLLDKAAEKPNTVGGVGAVTMDVPTLSPLNPRGTGVPPTVLLSAPEVKSIAATAMPFRRMLPSRPAASNASGKLVEEERNFSYRGAVIKSSFECRATGVLHAKRERASRVTG